MHVTGKAMTITWLPLYKKVIYPSVEEVYLNPPANVQPSYGRLQKGAIWFWI